MNALSAGRAPRLFVIPRPDQGTYRGTVADCDPRVEPEEDETTALGAIRSETALNATREVSRSLTGGKKTRHIT